MDNIYKNPAELYYTQSENTRTFDYGSNKIHVVREDPYGFWKITIDKGQLPDHLHHAIYTEFALAQRDVLTYLNQKRKVLVMPE